MYPLEQRRLYRFSKYQKNASSLSLKATGGRPSVIRVKDWFTEWPFLCISETSLELSEREIWVLAAKSGGGKTLSAALDK